MTTCSDILRRGGADLRCARYDVEAWKDLVIEVQRPGGMKHLTCEIFERLLQTFPTSARHWKLYAEVLLLISKPVALSDLRQVSPLVLHSGIKSCDTILEDGTDCCCRLLHSIRGLTRPRTRHLS